VADEVQRGESPDHAKLSAFGPQRGESPDHAKLGAYGKKKDCDHDHQPMAVRDERPTRRNPRLLRPMRFVSLHHHSTYSFLDGFQLPEAHVRRITELNGSALAMTEHGNVMSHAKFEQSAKKAGVKPIFGIELYTGEIDPERRTQLKNHLTILARNQDGYRNVLQLVSKSYMEGFYYEPTVSGSMLRKHAEGLVVLSGCQSGLLFSSLVGGKHIDSGDASYERGKAVAARFKRSLGDAYVLEVQAFPELTKTKWANPMIARISRELKIPMVATLDCHYTTADREGDPEDAPLAPQRRQVDTGGSSEVLGLQLGPLPASLRQAAFARLIETGLTREEGIRAINLTAEIAQDMTTSSYRSSDGPLPDCGTDKRSKQVFRGVDQGRLEVPRLRPYATAGERRRYSERIATRCRSSRRRTLSTTSLLSRISSSLRRTRTSESALPADRQLAVSSAGYSVSLKSTRCSSLILSLSGSLTSRVRTYPDIDLGLRDWTSAEIVDYAVAKYGRECVNQIGTFTKYKSKNALDDVARVYRIPTIRSSADQGRSPGDGHQVTFVRARRSLTPSNNSSRRRRWSRNTRSYAGDGARGQRQGFGIHAAGLAISNEPITEVVPILEREVKKRTVQVVGVDKYDAEYLGILKIDLLGLSAIDALVRHVRMLGEKPSSSTTSRSRTSRHQGFKENDVVGIFQYEGERCGW
jgi:DNA polymerase-3 subunit alpha